MPSADFIHMVYVWMPCLGIPWKIRIIFSDTTSFKHKLYSVYFVSVCRFDIWQEFNRVRAREMERSRGREREWFVFGILLCFASLRSNLYSTRWQSNFHIGDQPSKTTICRNAFEWESNVGRLRCSRHITVYVSGERTLRFTCAFSWFVLLVKMVLNLFDGLFCF